MVNVKEIRNKLKIIQNTKKITKAMEMIAASKMRKTQERMMSSDPYTNTILKVIKHLTRGNLEYKHPYLNTRNIRCVGYLVVATDRGLVGSLNTNLFKKLLTNIAEWNKKNVETKLALIGTKAVSFFNLLENKVVAQVTNIIDTPKLYQLTQPINIMLKLYEQGNLDKLYIISNKFINIMSQVPQITQILPLVTTEELGFKAESWDYLYEPDAQILLNNLLYLYVRSQVYQNVAENLTSEQAARMVAMKAASDNGNSLITELQLLYNKTRQTNITQELTEIVSGALL